MRASSDTEGELRDVELRIEALARQASELERALGALCATNTDATDEALRSAQHALGLYQRRRDMLRQRRPTSAASSG